MLSILSCVCWQSVYLLWRNVYLGLLPIFGLGCLFFWYWAAWLACILWRLMWTIFKVFIEFVTIFLLFYVLVFGCETCGILAPQPGIELTPPALEGKVLTTGPPGKSPACFCMAHKPRIFPIFVNAWKKWKQEEYFLKWKVYRI